MSDTTTAPYVRYEVGDGIATLTLDSPHNRNALSSRLVAELLGGLDDAAADPAVRAIVLAHTGNTFCAGADLSEAGDADPAVAADERTRSMIGVLRRLVEIPKPVVARIDGNVRAGGMPPCHGTVMLSINRIRPLKRYISATSSNTAS